MTDKGFSNKLKDLLKYKPNYDLNDLHILKTGRQFRINAKSKLFVGRDEKENETLLSFSQPGDYIFDVIDIPSPIGLLRGDVTEKEIILSSSIIARYSDLKSDKIKVSYNIAPLKEIKSLIVNPATETTLQTLRL